MEKRYVEKRDEGYWVAGSRVSLDSVVFAFLDGLSPETIVAECFPVLTLEQVYGAIAYYLSHRIEIDAYLQQADAEFGVELNKRGKSFTGICENPMITVVSLVFVFALSDRPQHQFFAAGVPTGR